MTIPTKMQDDECTWCGKTIEAPEYFIEATGKPVCEECLHMKWCEIVGPIRDELTSIRAQLGEYVLHNKPFWAPELRELAGALMDLADRLEQKKAA